MPHDKYVWIIAGILVLIVVLVVAKHNSSQNQIYPSQISPSTPFYTPTPTQTETPLSSPAAKPVSTNTPAVSGVTRGQIICDYQIPAAPNQPGTAGIDSNWNNANINVCVSANGGSQTLLSSDTRTSGSRTDSAPWISLNVEYIFTLYNRGPNDPTCSGTVLSSCQINSK